MYLVIRNEDNIIESSIVIEPQYLEMQEDTLKENDRYIIEIPDEEFTIEMIGAIYDGGEEA